MTMTIMTTPNRAGTDDEPAAVLRGVLDDLRATQLRAEIALHGMGADPTAPADILAELLRTRPALAHAHRDRVLGPVLAIGDTYWRNLLLGTLTTWLATGNANKTAAALFCHRNTVLNRLRAVERLTGLRLAVPGDLLTLALAAEAHRLLGD